MPLASVTANWLAGWGPDQGQVLLTATSTLTASGRVQSGAEHAGRVHRFAPAPDAPNLHRARVLLTARGDLTTTGHAGRHAHVILTGTATTSILGRVNPTPRLVRVLALADAI